MKRRRPETRWRPWRLGPRGRALLPLLPLFLLLLLPGPARAELDEEGAPCPPIVQLEGAAELVAPIAAELGRHGIAGRVPGCPILRARLEQRGALFAVTLIEELRRSERTVADLRTAASVIESFVRSDLSAPLLGGPLPAAQPDAEPRPATGTGTAHAAPAPAHPRAHLPLPRFQVALLSDVGVDITGAAWLGAALRLCAQVGPVCIGLLARAGGDLPTLRKDGLLDQRVETQLLAGAELPLRLLGGRMVLSPGVGLGLGWMHHRVHGRQGTPPMGGDSGGDHDNDPDDYFDVLGVSDGGMRAEVRLLSALRLPHGLAVELGVALGAAFLNSPVVLLAVGKGLSEGVAETPWGTLRFGLGLRWSGP